MRDGGVWLAGFFLALFGTGMVLCSWLIHLLALGRELAGNTSTCFGGKGS